MSWRLLSIKMKLKEGTKETKKWSSDKEDHFHLMEI